MGDSSLRSFIHKNISYKLHAVEIEKMLKLYSNTAEVAERERAEQVISCHLQLVVDKIGLLVAYMLYHARTEATPEMRSVV